MNELDVAFIVGIELFFLFAMAALGREYLYGSIAVNMVLVSLTGSKLIELFGMVTNIGNVFYAGVFIATYLLFEQAEEREARISLGIGVTCALMFAVLGQLVVGMHGLQQSGVFDAALESVLGASVRISFASMLAFVIAQTLNIWIYQSLQRRGTVLALRVAAASGAAQVVDSILFFGIAFAGVIPLATLVVSAWVGLALKLGVTALAVPQIYFFRRRSMRARRHSAAA